MGKGERKVQSNDSDDDDDSDSDDEFEAPSYDELVKLLNKYSRLIRKIKKIKIMSFKFKMIHSHLNLMLLKRLVMSLEKKVKLCPLNSMSSRILTKSLEMNMINLRRGTMISPQDTTC
jgi:hypothetical protein